MPVPYPKRPAAATALAACDCPSARAREGLIRVTPGIVEHGACGPTQIGMNRQPSAATLLIQDLVKLP